jgi:hypothetical protein
MDEENTTSRPDSSRRRLKIAGIATVALLAVPGGAAISNAFAADGGSAATTPAQSTQGPRGDHGDCPGKGGEGHGGEPGTTGTADTGYTLQ